MYNLTGVYWIKNEVRYIPEYLEFHLLHGFDHFVFYDNGSTDNLEESIMPYLEAGLVEIRHYPPGIQGAKNAWVMENSIDNDAYKTRWIHFHALDERLVNPDGHNIVDVLDDVWGASHIGGAAIPWVIMNCSGHFKRPEGLIIENYTQATQDRMYHIKTVIKPSVAIRCDGNPHNFQYVPDKYTVNERGNVILGAFSKDEYPMDKLKLYHYLSLSRQEFDEKMNKGVLDVGAGRENEKRFDADFQWELAHDPRMLLGEDTSLLKYVDPVREAIARRYHGREHLMERFNH